MKKFLIAVICIIPVIVVLALSVTSDIILQVTAANPDRLEIRRFDDSVVEDGATIEIDISNFEDYLVIDVLPGMVQNKEITWRLTEEEGMTGEVELEKMEGSSNRYWIVPVEPGVCTMEIRPEGNYDVVRTIIFNVTTTEITRFEVYREGHSEPVATAYADGAEPVSETVVLKKAERFYTSATPFSAFTVLEGDETEWGIGAFSSAGSGDDEDSSDEDTGKTEVTERESAKEYLHVDDTGLVTPLKRADVAITVTVYLKSDKAGNAFLATFNVDLSEVVVKSTEAVCTETGKSDAEMTEWVKNNLVVSETAEVTLKSHENNVWRFNVTEPVRLAARDAGDGASFEITVIESDYKWGLSALPGEIYAGNGNQSFSVVSYDGLNYAAGDVPDEKITGYTAISLNEDILVVDAAKGLLKPRKAGVATIVLTYGGETQTYTVTVRERPVTFALQLTSTDGERGIARDRYWGSYWLSADNSDLVTEFDFGLASQYATGTFEVQWTVSVADMNGVPVEEEELADYVVMTVKGHSYEGVTLDFREKAPGSDITVTAKLYMQNRVVEEVQRSFTFDMLEKRNSVNVYDFEDFKAVYKRPTYDYVLQSDIRAAAVTDEFLADKDLGGDATRGDNVFPNMMGSIYGNGFLYDASDVQVRSNDQGALSYRYQIFLKKMRAMYNAEHNTSGNPSAGDMKAYFVEKGVDEFVIYNLKMRGAETLEAADNTFSVLCYALGMYNEREITAADTPRDPPMAIRYCEVYNSERGIQLERVNDVLIEGCILGDNYKHSVFGYNHVMPERRYPNYIYADRKDPSSVTGPNTATDDTRPGYNLTFRNNVFKRTQGPAICFAGTSTPNGVDWGDFSACPNIYFEGMAEIYNWKTKKEFRQAIIDLITYYIISIVSRDDPGALDTVEGLLNRFLEPVVDEFMAISENNRLYYKYGGEEYIGLGLFGAGCCYGWDPDDMHLTGAAARAVMKAELRMGNADGTLNDAMSMLETVVSALKVPGLTTVSESCWMICNNFASGAPEIGPDDPVPSSEAMYDKLTAAKGDEMPWDKFGS